MSTMAIIVIYQKKLSGRAELYDLIPFIQLILCSFLHNINYKIP